MKKISILISLLVCLILASSPALGGGFKKSIGQTVYAPANHNCYFPWPAPEIREAWHCTLSVNSRLGIRNIDLNHSITVTEISLYDPDGDFVSELLLEPVEIPPLASATFAVPKSGPDSPPYWTVFTEGKPSFIVKWTAERRVHPPNITSSHAIINWTPGPPPNLISFEGLTVTPGTVLKEDWRDRW